MNIKFEKWMSQEGGGFSKVDFFCNIKTLFEEFLAFLDTYQVVFSPYIAIAEKSFQSSLKKLNLKNVI